MFAFYDHFRIENEAKKYRLRLPGRYSGTAKDALAHSVNWWFSTFDADYDVSATLNCAVHFHGGWWYQSCADANLNGMWNTQAPTGVFWKWAKNKKPVSFSEMKIRRVKAPREP